MSESKALPGFSLKTNLRDVAHKFIVGNRSESVDIPGAKMKLLRGQFALLCMFLGIIYALVVMLRGDFRFLPWHVLLISGGVLAFYLNRSGRYTASTLTLFVLTNSFVYLFSSVNRPQDGMYFYYFITNSLSIILMGYGRLWLTIVLVLLTLTLAIFAYLFPSFIIPIPKDITPDVEQMIFLINLVISILFGSYVLISVIRANYFAENKLIKNHQELKKINEELDRFVYSASHDMRAPLSSLLGLINVAEKTSSLEEKAMCLNMMRERIGVMEGFLKEITDYSRNVRSVVEKKPLLVLDAINDSLNELGFLFERDKIIISTDVDSALTVMTDKQRFTIVLNNLISNGIKYYDPDKKNPSITIRARTHQKQFSLVVEDNGIGIGREHVHRIFSMFYRATTIGEGSGLGLYIVKETVQKLGGTISAASEEGKGSTFTVILPQ
jgi:signal transduction histidine kinase